MTQRADGTWGDWQRLGTQRFTDLVATRDAAGRIAVFGTAGGTVYHARQRDPDSSTWNLWRRIPGPCCLQVVADLAGSEGTGADAGRVFLVGLHRNGRPLYSVDQTGSGEEWTPWESLATDAKLGAAKRFASLTLARHTNGRLQLFGIERTTRLVYYTWQRPSGSWSGEWVAGAAFTGLRARQIAVGRNDNGRLELYAVDAAGRVWDALARVASQPGPWLPRRLVSRRRLADRPILVAPLGDGAVRVFGSDAIDEMLWATGGKWQRHAWLEL